VKQNPQIHDSQSARKNSVILSGIVKLGLFASATLIAATESRFEVRERGQCRDIIVVFSKTRLQ
jgi:hypothetical protein